MEDLLRELVYCPKCGSKHFNKIELRAKKCDDCGFIYYKNAAAAVAAFCVNDKGELLMTRRAFNPSKGMLDLPGGFVDFEETAEEALALEIREELGVDIISSKYLFSFPNKYSFSEMTVCTLDLFFLVTLDSFNLSPGDDVCDALFVDVNTLSIDAIGLDSIKKAVSRFKDIFTETGL